LHEYGIKWRRGLNDDTIVSLDILKTGYWCTAENRAIGIGKIGTSRKGRLEGGMTDFYAQGGFMKKSAELVRLHPDCTTTVVKFNRVHHVVDFSKFTQKLIPVNQDARPTKRTVTPTPAKKASTSPTTLAGCEYLTNLVANPETEVTYPVYIPSKGRANTGTTHKLLTEAGIPYTLVIEPQDVEAYKNYPATQTLVLDKNDAGMDYTRNYIKDHATALGAEYHWQLDDDIKRFVTRQNGKTYKANAAHALNAVEQTVNLYTNVGVAAPAYDTWIHTREDAMRVNKMVASAKY
jgi:hypothetical protein